MRVDAVMITGAGETGRGQPAPPRLARLQDWSARHRVVIDILVGVLLVGGGLAPRASIDPELWWTMGPQALLVAPLLARRRYPFAVFGWLYLLALSQWWLGRAVLIDAAILVALYTVATLSDRRRALLAAALVEIGVVIAAIRWAPGGFDGVLTAMIFLSGLVTAAFVLGVNTRTRRIYLASLEDRAGRAERDRDQQSQLATAAERARIAREMHDIVTHNLSVLVALADGVAFAAEHDPDTAQFAAHKVAETGRQALQEMQRLVSVLRGTEEPDPRTPQPGLGQIDDLITQVRAAGLPTSLTVVGAAFPVPTTAQLAVYRVVQESLTNVLKHAKDPSRAHVTLSYAEPAIILHVSDDGRGEPRPVNVPGHGVAGMRERAAVFGGHVDAGPGQHGGWQVRMILSCPKVAS
ncbi:MAG TPA: histidine kinase [Pseudonocardiaceae bacterium]